MAAKSKPNEIHISRIYDAPVETVWDAWIDPKKVAKWWGPRGFTLTTAKKDVRPGGTWNYVMHGPDGTDYPNVTTFHEVEKYSRLVYDHGANENQPPMFRVTVTFEEIKGKTHMEMTMALATAEAATETKKFIKKAGGNSTWDRLAEYLADDKKFVINNSFEVSLAALKELWADPKVMQVPSSNCRVTFTAEGADQTRVTVECEIASPAEKAGLAAAWGGSFDKMENYLAKLK